MSSAPLSASRILKSTVGMAGQWYSHVDARPACGAHEWGPRRARLYSVDQPLAGKRAELRSLDDAFATDVVLRNHEELSEQLSALSELNRMAAACGCEAATAPEAD
ncbi:hypothetical protein ABZ912_47095 [Nonomuraea angiospora]|uniref:hypothetical protein n=1 Tax=Nonomuraea angiospora TaxID=46172 RepID=UPI0033C7F817